MSILENIKHLVSESIKSDNPHFIFITGSAGTGKTTLAKKLRKEFKKSAIVAPTGVAALTCHGQTIHSLFKFKVGIPLSKLVKGKRVKGPNKKVIENLELLVIDEISMVSAPMLDTISESLKKIKKNQEPFGGITILASGDLCQLPPVITKEEENQLKKLSYTSRYFFSSNSFSEVRQAGCFYPLELKENYRHEQDHKYLALLNRFRRQERMEDVIDQFNHHCYKHVADQDADFVLAELVIKVKKINEDGLNKLEAKGRIYPAKRMTGTFQRMKEKTLPAPSELKLKTQAKVMMTRNDPKGRWVNGSSGVIIDQDDDVIKVKIGKFVRKVERETWEDIGYEEDKGELVEVIKGRFEQFPITLGWAVTIHKAQGLTLDSYVIDMAHHAFDHGQMYVALSRGRRLKDLKFKNHISIKDCIFDQVVTDFLNSLEFQEWGNYESKQTDEPPKENSQTPKNEKVIDPNDMILDVTLNCIIDLSYEELRKKVEDSDYDEFNKLRKKSANEKGKPHLHNIVTARAMLIMMITKPRTDDDFLEIPGIGPIFIEHYLKQFSDLINKLYPESEKEPTKEKQKIKNSRDDLNIYEISQLIYEAEHKETLKEMQDSLKKIREVLKIDQIANNEITSLTISDEDLYEELRMERSKIAAEEDVPAYMVAPNKTLEELAEIRPSTLTEMLDISGIADVRLEKYGQSFLDILNKYRDK